MADVIKPTVGRVVLFVPKESAYAFGYCLTGGESHAALVCYVHTDRLVNLSVFDSTGRQFGRTFVTLQQPGDPEPGGDYCRWMGYQIGQAKAHAEAKPA